MPAIAFFETFISRERGDFLFMPNSIHIFIEILFATLFCSQCVIFFLFSSKGNVYKSCIRNVAVLVIKFGAPTLPGLHDCCARFLHPLRSLEFAQIFIPPGVWWYPTISLRHPFPLPSIFLSIKVGCWIFCIWWPKHWTSVYIMSQWIFRADLQPLTDFTPANSRTFSLAQFNNNSLTLAFFTI